MVHPSGQVKGGVEIHCGHREDDKPGQALPEVDPVGHCPKYCSTYVPAMKAAIIRRTAHPSAMPQKCRGFLDEFSFSTSVPVKRRNLIEL